MAETTTPGLGDLLALFGGVNPFAGISKSVAQFQRGVTQFLDSVERFNDTLEQLNLVARRVNTLLDTVEGPVMALMPQLTRTIKTADMLVEQLSGPVERFAPTLSRFADTFANPNLAAFPMELGEFLETLGDLTRRLQPLGQLAETAGGWFGLRPLAALRSGSGHAPPPAPKSTVSKSPAKKAAAAKKTPPAKKPAATKKSR